MIRNPKLPIYEPSEKSTVELYGGMWNPRKMVKVRQKYQKHHCQNYSKCGKTSGYIVSVPRVFSYDLDALPIIKLRG